MDDSPVVDRVHLHAFMTRCGHTVQTGALGHDERMSVAIAYVIGSTTEGGLAISRSAANAARIVAEVSLILGGKLEAAPVPQLGVEDSASATLVLPPDAPVKGAVESAQERSPWRTVPDEPKRDFAPYVPFILMLAALALTFILVGGVMLVRS